jgi:hypothetical protein
MNEPHFSPTSPSLSHSLKRSREINKFFYNIKKRARRKKNISITSEKKVFHVDTSLYEHS